MSRTFHPNWGVTAGNNAPSFNAVAGPVYNNGQFDGSGFTGTLDSGNIDKNASVYFNSWDATEPAVHNAIDWPTTGYQWSLQVDTATNIDPAATLYLMRIRPSDDLVLDYQTYSINVSSAATHSGTVEWANVNTDSLRSVNDTFAIEYVIKQNGNHNPGQIVVNSTSSFITNTGWVAPSTADPKPVSDDLKPKSVETITIISSPALLDSLKPKVTDLFSASSTHSFTDDLKPKVVDLSDVAASLGVSDGLKPKVVDNISITELIYKSVNDALKPIIGDVINVSQLVQKNWNDSLVVAANDIFSALIAEAVNVSDDLIATASETILSTVGMDLSDDLKPKTADTAFVSNLLSLVDDLKPTLTSTMSISVDYDINDVLIAKVYDNISGPPNLTGIYYYNGSTWVKGDDVAYKNGSWVPITDIVKRTGGSWQ